MRGWLVINAFLKTSKFDEIYSWLVEAAKKKRINLEIKTNAELLYCLGTNEEKTDSDNVDFVLFWDKDVRLARLLENKGMKLYNSSHAIEICDDKSLTHLTLQQQGINIPKTIIAPMTFAGIGYTNTDFLSEVEEKLKLPVIVKECFGSFGQQVYLIQSHSELVSKVKELEGRPLLFQEFIKSSFARDVRLQIVGGEVVASMYRYSDNGDFRANISNGGKMKRYKPTKEQEELALEACRAIEVDFAGVDLLFGEENEPIVCEVNSNAHFKNIHDCTGVDVADYILNSITEFPVSTKK